MNYRKVYNLGWGILFVEYKITTWNLSKFFFRLRSDGDCELILWVRNVKFDIVIHRNIFAHIVRNVRIYFLTSVLLKDQFFWIWRTIDLHTRIYVSMHLYLEERILMYTSWKQFFQLKLWRATAILSSSPCWIFCWCSFYQVPICCPLCPK
jgi:hypothetical protein